MIDAALRQQIVSAPEISALIGTRLYPLVWPDKPLFPLVTFQLVSTISSGSLEGSLGNTVCRIEFDCWASDFAGSQSVAKALNDVLEDFSGALPDGSQVLQIELDNCSSNFDEASLSYRTTADYLVSFYRD